MKKTKFFFTAILLISVAACSAVKTSEQTRLWLENSPEEGVYEKDSIKITIRPATGADVAGNALFEKFLSKDYILLKMDMENKSAKKLTFNPAMSHLLAGVMDYKKPLDYPDLYRILSTPDAAITPEAELRAIKGRFYDMNTVVKAGEKTSKLLIFRPLDPNSETNSAAFTMQELYVGVDTIVVTFPFAVKRK